MLTNEQVVAWWARGTAAGNKNLESDGVSLWSYGWYEIGRIVGSRMYYMRHKADHFSAATQRHLGLAYITSRVQSAMPLTVRGDARTDRNSAGRNLMYQPCWSWLALHEQFHGPSQTDGFRRGGVWARIKPSAKFRGDGRLAALRNARAEGRIDALYRSSVGWVKVRFVVLKESERVRPVSRSKVTSRKAITMPKARRREYEIEMNMRLSDLERIHPPLPVSCVATEELRTQGLPFVRHFFPERAGCARPSWYGQLFSSAFWKPENELWEEDPAMVV